MTTRRERWDALVDHYQPQEALGHASEFDGERFAIVSSETLGDDVLGAIVRNCATFEDACELLADHVYQGYAAEAVYDLDTGERIEINVSVKVTRSEDQGVMENPLDPEEGAS